MQMNVAEIFYQTGELQCRFACYLSGDGSQSIRHGRFASYHRNGELASEGSYVNGFEDGVWRNYHDNGELAAEGCYDEGEKIDTWRYWERG